MSCTLDDTMTPTTRSRSWGPPPERETDFRLTVCEIEDTVEGETGNAVDCHYAIEVSKL